MPSQPPLATRSLTSLKKVQMAQTVTSVCAHLGLKAPDLSRPGSLQRPRSSLAGEREREYKEAVLPDAAG